MYKAQASLRYDEFSFRVHSIPIRTMLIQEECNRTMRIRSTPAAVGCLASQAVKNLSKGFRIF